MAKEIRTLADCPEWTSAQQKLAEIQSEYTEADQEINRIVSHRTSENDRDIFQDAATSLLAGEEVTLPLTGNDEYERQLRLRRLVLNLAIDQLKRDMNNLKPRLSEKICSEVRPEYTKAVKEMAGLAEKLLVAMAREQEIRYQLQEGNVDIHHLGVAFPLVSGRLKNFLESAKTAGHI